MCSSVGRKVQVRFDPFDLRSVLVLMDSGESVRAFPVDIVANRRVRRQPSAQESPRERLPLGSLDKLANDMKPPEENDDDNDQEEGGTCAR